MKKLFYTLVIFLSLIAFCSHAQTILNDQKGEPLFVVPSSLTSFKLSSKVVGLDLPLYSSNPTQFYIVDKNGIEHNTMRMAKSIYAGITFVENSKSTLIFSKNTNISPSLEIGFKRTLDQLEEPAFKSGTYYTFALAIFAKYQRFTEYDKMSKIMLDDKFSRISPGVRLNLNIFRKDQYALALNGSWQKSVNVDKLTSFQSIKPTFYIDENVASNGDQDGYIGPIDPSHQYRLSAAWSVYAIPALRFPSSFRFSEDLNKLQFAITPYYFINTEKFDKIAHNAGVGLSILPDRIFGQSNATFKDALTFSYNFLKSADKSNARFLYISGTFSFGKSKSVSKRLSQ